jgi:antitoxin MazE
MKATQLEVDEVVEVREDRGRIVIEPVRPRRYELSELLKGITKKNEHRELVPRAGVEPARPFGQRAIT